MLLAELTQGQSAILLFTIVVVLVVMAKHS